VHYDDRDVMAVARKKLRFARDVNFLNDQAEVGQQLVQERADVFAEVTPRFGIQRDRAGTQN
jgi:hypothetical protein